jgi:hypothetical protein
MMFSMTGKSLPNSMVIPLGSRIVTGLPSSGEDRRSS